MLRKVGKEGSGVVVYTATDFQVPKICFFFLVIYDSLYRRFPIPPFFRQSRAESGSIGGRGRLYTRETPRVSLKPRTAILILFKLPNLFTNFN